ncbi:hypothetical protein, partial [Yersinia mollaretii]|uniref:hypothetical protein n=1 Tax=Yersinia mollaretii TaxID=33060 RepID=UPI001E35E2D2
YVVGVICFIRDKYKLIKSNTLSIDFNAEHSISFCFIRCFILSAQLMMSFSGFGLYWLKVLFL